MLALIRRLLATPPDRWRARCIAGTWIVSRQVGGTIENLYHPPLGYKDSSTLASYKTAREARNAARKANQS